MYFSRHSFLPIRFLCLALYSIYTHCYNHVGIIEGLEEGGITLAASSGGGNSGAVSPGTLTGNGSVYAFGVSGIDKPGTIIVSVTKSGDSILSKTAQVYYAEEAKFTGVTADGLSSAQTTAELTLTFDKEIAGLGWNDITVTNSGGLAAKAGDPLGGGQTWRLPVTVTGQGTVSVAVSKSGYVISGSPKDVTVHYAAPVTLSVTVNGGANATTTELRLTFDRSVTGLTKENIAVENVAGLAAMNNESLTASGNTWDLPVTVIKSGTVNVRVSSSPAGYAVSGSLPVGCITLRRLRNP